MTKRENALCALRHQCPERIVDLLRDCNMLGTYIIKERGQAVPGRPSGGDGADWFGVQWKCAQSCNAPTVDPTYPPILEDICDWETIVKFPVLEQIDWDKAAKADLENPTYDPDKLNQVCILNGPFERLHALMGFENALVSLIAEPEACADFFQAVADYKIDLIDHLHGVYPIDLIDFHDDWGHQNDAFFSAETWNTLLKNPIMRIQAHCKSLGIHYQHHSCGKIDILLPSMVDAGIEHLSSCQAMNNIPHWVHTYGHQVTFFGCMDTDAVRQHGLSQEEIDFLTAARIDDICRGGAVFPLGNSTIPGLSEAVRKALDARVDFFHNAANKKLP